jgi:ribosomal protein S3
LSQKYHIFEILNPVIKELKKTKGILGFKIVCAGRLTKKQRAGLIVSRKRSVPLNTVNSIIDYSTGIVILRHGVSCIKVWLNKSKFFKVYNQAFIFKY